MAAFFGSLPSGYYLESPDPREISLSGLLNGARVVQSSPMERVLDPLARDRHFDANPGWDAVRDKLLGRFKKSAILNGGQRTESPRRAARPRTARAAQQSARSRPVQEMVLDTETRPEWQPWTQNRREQPASVQKRELKLEQRLRARLQLPAPDPRRPKSAPRLGPRATTPSAALAARLSAVTPDPARPAAPAAGPGPGWARIRHRKASVLGLRPASQDTLAGDASAPPAGPVAAAPASSRVDPFLLQSLLGIAIGNGTGSDDGSEDDSDGGQGGAGGDGSQSSSPRSSPQSPSGRSRRASLALMWRSYLDELSPRERRSEERDAARAAVVLARFKDMSLARVRAALLRRARSNRGAHERPWLDHDTFVDVLRGLHLGVRSQEAAWLLRRLDPELRGTIPVDELLHFLQEHGAAEHEPPAAEALSPDAVRARRASISPAAAVFAPPGLLAGSDAGGSDADAAGWRRGRSPSPARLVRAASSDGQRGAGAMDPAARSRSRERAQHRGLGVLAPTLASTAKSRQAGSARPLTADAPVVGSGEGVGRARGPATAAATAAVAAAAPTVTPPVTHHSGQQQRLLSAARAVARSTQYRRRKGEGFAHTVVHKHDAVTRGRHHRARVGIDAAGEGEAVERDAGPEASCESYFRRARSSSALAVQGMSTGSAGVLSYDPTLLAQLVGATLTSEGEDDEAAGDEGAGNVTSGADGEAAGHAAGEEGGDAEPAGYSAARANGGDSSHAPPSHWSRARQAHGRTGQHPERAHSHRLAMEVERVMAGRQVPPTAEASRESYFRRARSSSALAVQGMSTGSAGVLSYDPTLLAQLVGATLTSEGEDDEAAGGDDAGFDAEEGEEGEGGEEGDGGW